MRNPALSRRMIALAAAYVVALQALLLPLSVAAGASFATGLCLTSAERSHAPASHESGCGCAAGCGMQCGAQALLVPPQVSIAIELTLARVMTHALALEPAVRPLVKRPQNPRAPPAA